MVMLEASFLVVVFSMGVLAPAIAQNGQNRKPRKKLKELLMKAIACDSSCDSLLIGDICSNGATLFSWQN